jgi:hypothetical protein
MSQQLRGIPTGREVFDTITINLYVKDEVPLDNRTMDVLVAACDHMRMNIGSLLAQRGLDKLDFYIEPAD